MKRSTDRILTTHTGSLPRPLDLLALIRERESGQPIDSQVLGARVASAVAEVVRKQLEIGIDVVSDGEFGKPGFNVYVAERLEGFGGTNAEPRVRAEAEEFPEWSRQPSSGGSFKRPFCVGPVKYRSGSGAQTDIKNLKTALGSDSSAEGFLPSASLGVIDYTITNKHYPSVEAYLFALADAMKEEYRAITNAGLILQIDAPDNAMDRSVTFRGRSLGEFRKAQAIRVEALNHALEGIPEEQVRYHICWGNFEGPHTHDVALRDIIDLVLKVRAGAYVVESSNPRHAHEWQVWQDVKLPPGKILIPGVIDTTTNFVEHPELVAQRIRQFARIVGRENVIGGTDCGFGTFAGRDRVFADITWAKLKSLVEGAKLATKRLFG
ncbi:MAG: epoxyalkane--coenzyme M transferase [Deltaproteobacteria bacterium]|nr:epoxyalkane--coenzyme M transferase [Deltaproteobacteria bacterium]